MNTIGEAVRLTVFGESHSAATGCVIDGLPAGFKPDFEMIRSELMRRMTANGGAGASKRREKDEFTVHSGLYNDKLTGAPLSVTFENIDVRPKDYSERIARPSHADLAAFIKYGGHNDQRGGGQFSGRLTLPLVFAGALAKQILKEKGIEVFSHVSRIGDVKDTPFDSMSEKAVKLDPFFPLINEKIRSDMENILGEAKSRGDTVGGEVECAMTGVPVGVGEPLFASFEGELSRLLFAIPGLRGVEFGESNRIYGSDMNDEFTDKGRTLTNRSGGVNGGLSNGMPVVFRVWFRPIPSVSFEQTGYNLEKDCTARMAIKGRHDVCILPRGAVVVEAAASFALLDLTLRSNHVI